MTDTREAILRTLLEAGKSIRFQAHGRSMAPFIRDGDTLTIEPAKPSDLRRGAILFCSAPDNRFLCHRILSLRRHKGVITAYTRGDALTGQREAIPEAAILGLVVASQRNGKSNRLDTLSSRFIGQLWACGQTWRAKIGIRLGAWRKSL